MNLLKYTAFFFGGGGPNALKYRKYFALKFFVMGKAITASESVG